MPPSLARSVLAAFKNLTANIKNPPGEPVNGAKGRG
jgi:hypothetical protein